MKTQIKARQSRRIMMIIRNKKMIPYDIQDYNEMMRDYHSAYHWKINH
jgi:transcription initiation factor IIE alpha subunit